MKNSTWIGITLGGALFGMALGGCAATETSTDQTTVSHERTPDGSARTETHTKSDTTTPGIPAAPTGTTTTTTTGQ